MMKIVHGDLRKRVLSEGESSANIWVHDRESSRMDDLRSFQDQRHGRYSFGYTNSRTSAILRCEMGRSNRRDDIEIQRMRSSKTCTSDSETKRIRSNSHLRRTWKTLFKWPNRTPRQATENGGSQLGPEDMRETCLISWSSARKRHISCGKSLRRQRTRNNLSKKKILYPDLKGSRSKARPGNKGSREVFFFKKTDTHLFEDRQKATGKGMSPSGKPDRPLGFEFKKGHCTRSETCDCWYSSDVVVFKRVQCNYRDT